jgi:phenylacetate-CoA ligase
MEDATYQGRRQLEQLPRAALQEYQLERLNGLLRAVLPHNRFYAHKLRLIELPLRSMDQLAALPFTFKEELVQGLQRDQFSANQTFDSSRYVRLHRTSGTHGRPMVVVDTLEDWQWWTDVWQYVLDAADVQPYDRVFMAFSFGPFIGFWSAHDACVARQAMVIPGGGMDSLARLDLIHSSHATVLCCTPSYALHLSEVAAAHQIDTRKLGVRRIIVAGEPGGSAPATRQRIESAWNARLVDHAGATEVGPWGYADSRGLGLHVAECEFIAEFHSVKTGQPAEPGELSELILTTLGRHGCPVIRYRTADLVRPTYPDDPVNRFVLLEGGVVGRTDEMLVIRGVNVFPSALEQILHSFPEVVEYQITAYKAGEMDALRIAVEDRLDRPERIARELKLRLGLNIQVQVAPAGSLPRFEGKGRRFVDQR